MVENGGEENLDGDMDEDDDGEDDEHTVKKKLKFQRWN